jgi:hypothetical protein
MAKSTKRSVGRRGFLKGAAAGAAVCGTKYGYYLLPPDVSPNKGAQPEDFIRSKIDRLR